MVQLFKSVHFISAKIKAVLDAFLLDIDHEYITLIKNHLPQEQKRNVRSGLLNSV